MHDLEARLRKALADIAVNDPELSEELEALSRGEETDARVNGLMEALDGRPGLERSFAQKSIIHGEGRPALRIFHDEPLLEFHDAKSEVWRGRLLRARAHLARAARAVGRIEIERHPDFEPAAPIGTGWLVHEEVVVTNRHVARVFAEQGANGFVFARTVGGVQMGAAIDFLEEDGVPQSLSFAIREILHVEKRPGPDMAFLLVEPTGDVAPPLVLSSKSIVIGRFAAAIGYPGRDGAIPDQDKVRAIFGDVFDKKRLSPGQVTGFVDGVLLHDCSTLNANSGSLLVDLCTGEALGLHFKGTYLRANYAVPARTIAERLGALGFQPVRES
jgi:endonuclease G